MKKNRKGSNHRKLLMAIALCLAAGIGLGFIWLRHGQSKAKPAVMVRIPAGEFMMGFNNARMSFGQDYMPAHPVQIKAFDIDKTEVTVEAYERCVQAEKCTAAKTDDKKQLCNYGHEDRKDHPINGVDWAQASAYCAWVECRLPTEAEWEYAARGGHDDWLYPWGNEEPDCTKAVMGIEPKKGDKYPEAAGCGGNGTKPVGSKGAFGFGLFDMAGNVDEWVQDSWHQNYKGAPEDGSAWMMEKRDQGVARGGHWAGTSNQMKIHFRQSTLFNIQHNSVGFRCARDAQEVQ